MFYLKPCYPSVTLCKGVESQSGRRALVGGIPYDCLDLDPLSATTRLPHHLHTPIRKPVLPLRSDICPFDRGYMVYTYSTLLSPNCLCLADPGPLAIWPAPLTPSPPRPRPDQSAQLHTLQGWYMYLYLSTSHPLSRLFPYVEPLFEHMRIRSQESLIPAIPCSRGRYREAHPPTHRHRRNTRQE